MSQWQVLERVYEGFPLYLRRPLGLEYNSPPMGLTILLTVTHTFNFRRLDGRPESPYNQGLEDFDVAVTGYFASVKIGQVVLVETFGGERNYYFYVAPSVDTQAMLSDLRTRYPENRLGLAWRHD